ncbi:MAG: HAD family phosphatase [Fretibacterium sp.]|nr:HAD family phosphatase [Fretibacterium sp.]
MFDGKKVMIFDMDGTLIDSVGIWNAVDEEVIRQIRADGAEGPAGDIQKQRDEALRRFSREENPYMAYCAFLGKKYGSSLSGEEIHTLRYDIARDYLQNKVDYKEGADVFIRRLKEAGYILTIATATRKANLTLYRTRNKNLMSRAALDDYFSLIYAREDAKEMKPSPEIYLRVMKELGAAPGECLVFEDSLVGIEAARNAGMDSVAIYDKYSDGEREQINALSTWQASGYPELLAVLPPRKTGL